MQHAGDILVVDDHAPTVGFIAEALTDEGYTVRTAPDAMHAHMALAERRPDLILIDLHLPGRPGDLLAHDLKSNGLGNLPVIIMTADTHLARALASQGTPFCLLKPFNLDDLLECVESHMRQVGSSNIAG